MRPFLVVIVTAVGCLSACSSGTADSGDSESAASGGPQGPIGGPDLDKSTVTSIPDGDASGTAFSGEYEVEVYTSACDGSCGPIESFGLPVSFCDVGDSDGERPNVTQTDGHVRMESGAAVTRMEGGIDADGAFDVGGFATELGGAIEITARITGTIDAGQHAMTADGKGRAVGLVDGHHIDCVGTYEIRPRPDG